MSNDSSRVEVVLFQATHLAPQIALQGDSTFAVQASLATENPGVYGATAEPAFATFVPSDLVPSAKEDGLASVRLATSADWTVTPQASNDQSCTVSITVSVMERGPNVDRTLATTQFTAHLADVVRRKVTTHIVQAPNVGRVAIALRVSPADTEGYQRRLTAFMQQHDKSLVASVGDISQRMGEVDAFSFGFNQYHVVDYRARAAAMLRLYSDKADPEAAAVQAATAVEAALLKWSGHEEDMMQHLVFDAMAPEPDAMDAADRVSAFRECHRVTDEDMACMPPTTSAEEFFTLMRNRYGEEPDPRRYLFGEDMPQPTTKGAATDAVQHVDPRDAVSAEASVLESGTEEQGDKVSAMVFDAVAKQLHESHEKRVKGEDTAMRDKNVLLDQLNSTMNQMELKDAQLDAANASLKKLSAEIEEMTADRDSAFAKLLEKSVKLDEVSTTNDAAQTRIDELAAEAEHATTALQELTETHEKLLVETMSSGDSISSTKERLVSALAENTHLAGELEVAMTSEQTATLRVAELEVDVQMTNGELRATKDSLTRISDALAEKSTSLRVMSDTAQQTSTDLRNAEAALQEAQLRIQALKAVQVQNEQLLTEVTAKEEVIREQSVAVKRATMESSRFCAQLAKTDDHLRAAQRDGERTSFDLERKEAALREAAADIKIVTADRDRSEKSLSDAIVEGKRTTAQLQNTDIALRAATLQVDRLQTTVDRKEEALCEALLRAEVPASVARVRLCVAVGASQVMLPTTSDATVKSVKIAVRIRATQQRLLDADSEGAGDTLQLTLADGTVLFDDDTLDDCGVDAAVGLVLAPPTTTALVVAAPDALINGLRIAPKSGAAIEGVLDELLNAELADDIGSTEHLERRMLNEDERMQFTPMADMHRVELRRVSRARAEAARMALVDRATFAESNEDRALAREAVAALTKVVENPTCSADSMMTASRMAEFTVGQLAPAPGADDRLTALADRSDRERQQRAMLVSQLKETIDLIQFRLSVPESVWPRAEEALSKARSYVTLSASLSVEELQECMQTTLTFVASCRK
jgi:hypothetical protein